MTMLKDMPTPSICSDWTGFCHTHASAWFPVCAVKSVGFKVEIYH